MHNTLRVPCIPYNAQHIAAHVTMPCIPYNAQHIAALVTMPCIPYNAQCIAMVTFRKPTTGIQYLVSVGLLEDSPLHVARFLHERVGLSKQRIGEFLGEIRVEFNMAVLE